MTFTWDDWGDWNDLRNRWPKKGTGPGGWPIDDFPAWLDETESPLLRDWARDGSDLDYPIPPKHERLTIRSSIEDQEALVLELQLNIAKQRAITAPIRMLPPEILSMIFVEADHSSDDDSCRKAILSCCRKWRQIGLTTPSFWSLIRVALPKGGNFYRSPHSCYTAGNVQVEHCLKLAGSAMLDVAIGSHNHGDMQNCELVELLSKKTSRIRSIDTRNAVGGMILARAFQSLDDLPNLVSIFSQTEFPEKFMDVSKASDESESDIHKASDESESMQLSGLQILSLRGYSLGDMTKVTCPQLTTLLIELPTLGEMPPESFWKFLGGMPNLRDLTGRFSALRGVWVTGYQRPDLTFPNLTILDLTNKNHDVSRFSSWSDTPGNYILMASPKVTHLEVLLDEGITSVPPPVPVTHVTTIFFKIEGSPRRKPPIATRRKRIRDWLEAFPAVRHLKIHDKQTNKGKGSELINVLLDSSTKRGHSSCCPSVTHIELASATMNHDTLLKFSRGRSLVSNGGVLQADTSNPVAKCLITLSKCARIRDVESANADMLLAAMILQELEEPSTSQTEAARLTERALERAPAGLEDGQDWDWWD